MAGGGIARAPLSVQRANWRRIGEQVEVERIVPIFEEGRARRLPRCVT
jgi:hypothetical protein